MQVRVPLPIRALVLFASVATPMLALCAALVATRALGIDDRVGWPMVVGPPAAVTLVLWLSLMRPMPVPRWIRATCVLVALHAIAIAIIWGLWSRAAALLRLDELLPLSDQLPIEKPAAAIAILLVGAALGWAVRAPRRGVPRWLDVAVRFLLVHLLALGLLVPIVAATWPSRGYATTLPSAGMVLATTGTIAVLNVLAAQWPRHSELRGLKRTFAAFAIVGALLVPVLAVVMSDDSRWVYSNFGHLIVANAFLALVAINLLGLFHWLAVRAPAARESKDPPWMQTGRVATADERGRVGWVRCSGWMEGLRIESASFTVQTPAGGLEVPAESRIAAPLPLSTINLSVGRRLPLLRDGDPVRATGYVAPPSDGPFRQSSLPVPGRQGVVVELLANAPARPRQDAVLAVWRPCFLYLAVATVIAIPAVIATLTYQSRLEPLMRSVYAPHAHRLYPGVIYGSAAAGPPNQLKPTDIQRGMSGILGKVQACYARFNVPGMANVTISISPNGRVSSAVVTGKFAGTETGHCVERAVETAVFPHFDGPPMSGIDYPFLFSSEAEIHADGESEHGGDGRGIGCRHPG